MDWRLLADLDPLVLATVEEVVAGQALMMADFRDTEALYYEELDGWLGLCRAGVMLGVGPPELVDGIWYVRRDGPKCERHRDHVVDPARASMRRL